MSWWQCDRATFQREIRERYAVNRGDPPGRGAYGRLKAEISRKDQASRGGKATKSQYRAQGRRKAIA